jgi:hypothetical protein
MSDEQFEEFLKRNAGDYNAPPASTPRDELWSVIAEARATRRPTSAGSGGAGGHGVTSLDARRPLRRYAPWIGMAATLVIGIGIGRYFVARQAPNTLALGDSLPAASATPTALVASIADTARDSSHTLDAPDAVAPQRAPQTAPLREAAVPVTRLASNAPERRLPAATPAEPNTTAFTLASREHLQRAEALVSVVAATPVDATMDSLTGKWAREMLVNTRLLLDSPAGDDPLRRRLLEDLETVLVQLIQRSGVADEDREILDRTLERTQLLTRLRTGAAGI